MRTKKKIIEKLKAKWAINLCERQDSIDLEIEKRVPIWNSISEFYLDTELQDTDYESITRTFLNSNFNISELKDIDLYEVFPVLKANTLNVAGVWIGFDKKWLKESCKKTYLKRKNCFFKRKTKFYNRFLYSMRKDHWNEIEKRMKTHYKKTL